MCVDYLLQRLRLLVVVNMIRVDIKLSANAQRIVAQLATLPRFVSRKIVAHVSGTFGKMVQELESPLTYSGRVIKPPSGRFIPKIRKYFASNIDRGTLRGFVELKGGIILPEEGKEWIEVPWKGSKEKGDFIIHGSRPVGGLGRGLQADAAMAYKRVGKRGVKPVTLLKKKIEIAEKKLPKKVLNKWNSIAKKYSSLFTKAVERAVEIAARMFEANIFKR